MKRRGLERWGAFISVTLALGMGISISGMPSPLYPLYQEAWQIPPSSLSYIFSAYMVGVLLSLLCLGRLSDAFGFFRVIIGTQALVAVGLLVSAFADGVGMLIWGRVLVGVANGVLTTAGAMALIDAHPARDRKIATLTTSLAITVGFGAGTVVSGLIAQTGMAPLTLPYLVVLLLILANMALLLRSRDSLQGPRGKRAPVSIQPRMALPAGMKRLVFLMAGAAGFSTFAIGSLFSSLVPSLLKEILPWKGPMVVGIAFGLLVTVSVFAQFSLRNMSPFKGLALGMAAFAGALAVLVAGTMLKSIVAVGFSVILTGVGQGLGFMNSSMIAGRNVDDKRPAASMATYFFLTYIGSTIPIIALGLLADYIGLAAAIMVYCGVMVVVLLALAWWALRYDRSSMRL